MSTPDLEQRLAALERRLAGMEAFLLRQFPSTTPGNQSRPATAKTAPSPVRAVSPKSPESDSRVIGHILGWGGAAALLLAASYLVKLAIDSGWLTPIRQVAFASLFGLLLIAGGFVMRRLDREYAGLLPAAGIAALFLSIYGGHLYHHVIGVREAAAAVILVCGVSLWLCRAFESDLFALFAVAGSYFAPFLLPGALGSIGDLAIYYSAWGVVFSVFAIWHKRRLIYLLALYLALIGFDMFWRGHGGDQWMAAFAFQLFQFVFFGATTAVFSVRHGVSLDTNEALAHLPPLLIFYFLQYTLLDQHLHALAPWIAVGSLAVLALIYALARFAFSSPLPGGELLLWSYAALVLFHAGYLEAAPKEWAPWIAVVLVPVAAALSIRSDEGIGSRWPIWIAVGLIFAVNYLRAVFDTDLHDVPAKQLLPIANAVLLYLGYWFTRRKKLLGNATALLIAAGHISAMAAAVHLLHEPIVESVAWGALAIACLALSLYVKDRTMGQSSLVVFAVTAGKVLLQDLSGASTIARIIGLAVIGVTFYAGGLLYQRLLIKEV